MKKITNIALLEHVFSDKIDGGFIAIPTPGSISVLLGCEQDSYKDTFNTSDLKAILGKEQNILHVASPSRVKINLQNFAKSKATLRTGRQQFNVWTREEMLNKYSSFVERLSEFVTDEVICSNTKLLQVDVETVEDKYCPYVGEYSDSVLEILGYL